LGGGKGTALKGPGNPCSREAATAVGVRDEGKRGREGGTVCALDYQGVGGRMEYDSWLELEEAEGRLGSKKNLASGGEVDESAREASNRRKNG